MRLFSDNHKSSITVYIDKLSNIQEIEWFQFQQLTESIMIQESGAKEAIEAIRKKLKHGTFHQKLRVLDILKLLMENSNQRFHRELVTNAKMKDRFDAILESNTEDNRIRMTVIHLLGMWSSKYKREPGMKSFGQLYDRNKLNKLYSVKPLSSPFEERLPPALIKNIPAPNHIQRENKKHTLTQDIALATQAANNLTSAIQRNIIHLDSYIAKCHEHQNIIKRHLLSRRDDAGLVKANENLDRALSLIFLEDPFADPA
ncbi:hypothetical protein K501DRAFT_279003 [Backusella circina FSU 941]|nr:hypothetical protein K501DRAFT_279003 [Backusella circina FSU 941]